jgi:hypothetical protein
MGGGIYGSVMEKLCSSKFGSIVHFMESGASLLVLALPKQF